MEPTLGAMPRLLLPFKGFNLVALNVPKERSKFLFDVGLRVLRASRAGWNDTNILSKGG